MGFSLRNSLQQLRERFHPLYYIRKSGAGRSAIRLIDRPVWLSVPGVAFKVRGRLVSHGLAFAAVGSQEPGSEALALTCLAQLKPASFWDVGANIGHYTWLLKSASPTLRAVLFEASAPNAELVRTTLQRNQFSDVALIAAGASDCAGSGELRVDSEAGATSTLDASEEQTFEEKHWGVAPGRLQISLVTIDGERAHRGKVDFLKIDVEGHEGAVLRGAQRTIVEDQPVIFIECFHPQHACLRWLEEQGYRLIDSDRLTAKIDGQSCNYFAFPEKFHAQIETLLAQARQRLQTVSG